MIKILITGGAGDWATSFKEKFQDSFIVETPNRQLLDVTSEDSISSYLKNKAFDVVINNAGSIHPARVLESKTQLWINDINVNLIGTYLVSKHILSINPKATVINVSSTAGYNAYPDWSSYCASKAGVITLSKSLANDNFSVFCLCPGAIDTKFRDKLDLSNANVMDCDVMSDHVIDIINNKYIPGDVLFFRKNEFILNP